MANWASNHHLSKFIGAYLNIKMRLAAQIWKGSKLSFFTCNPTAAKKKKNANHAIAITGFNTRLDVINLDWAGYLTIILFRSLSADCDDNAQLSLFLWDFLSRSNKSTFLILLHRTNRSWLCLNFVSFWPTLDLNNILRRFNFLCCSIEKDA